MKDILYRLKLNRPPLWGCMKKAIIIKPYLIGGWLAGIKRQHGNAYFYFRQRLTNFDCEPEHIKLSKKKIFVLSKVWVLEQLWAQCCFNCRRKKKKKATGYSCVLMWLKKRQNKIKKHRFWNSTLCSTLSVWPIFSKKNYAAQNRVSWYFIVR